MLYHTDRDPTSERFKPARSVRLLLASLIAISALHAQNQFPPSNRALARAIPLDGVWGSNWGDVRFENVRQQSDGTYWFHVSWLGLAESGRSEPVSANTYAPGVYNPQTGQLSFRYLQTSFNGADHGIASFTVSYF